MLFTDLSVGLLLVPATVVRWDHVLRVLEGIGRWREMWEMWEMKAERTESMLLTRKSGAEISSTSRVEELRACLLPRTQLVWFPARVETRVAAAILNADAGVALLSLPAAEDPLGVCQSRSPQLPRPPKKSEVATS